MKGIFSPVDNVREPPLPPRGEDIREPPLPSNDGSKDELPSEDENIDPEEGGGPVPRRLSGEELRPCASASDEIPENERSRPEPRP
jgi:hypothetical protein